MRKIALPFTVKKPILACGSDLKGSFALAKGREAYIVDGFGDLSDLGNFAKYEKAVKKYQKILGITPQIVACDLHPNYFSSRFAEDYALATKRYRLFKIQHHEAHIASAIIDSNIEGRVIGVAFDGTGYGFDNNIWGGEFFLGGLKGFKRVAHLEYIAMPGGEIAIKEPWRMAASYIYNAFGNYAPALTKRWPAKDLAILKTMIDKRINSPLTSSAGRLFDAVGSLILSKNRVSREAELPIELESMAYKVVANESYRFDICSESDVCIVKISMIIRDIIKDIAQKVEKVVMAAKFHNTMAEIILKTSLKLSKKFKVKQIVLSGGVFQNRYLTSRTIGILQRADLEVYTHSSIATNDLGIPICQIAIVGF